MNYSIYIFVFFLIINCVTPVKKDIYQKENGLTKNNILLLNESVDDFYIFFNKTNPKTSEIEILLLLFDNIESILYKKKDKIFKKFLKTHQKKIDKLNNSSLLNEIYYCEYQKPNYSPFMIKIANSLNVFFIYDYSDWKGFKNINNCKFKHHNYLGGYFTFLYKNSKNNSNFRNLLNELISTDSISSDILISGFKEFLKNENLTTNDYKMIKILVYTELILPKLLYESG